MSIPLHAIPKVLVSAIQEKMTPPTFCKLRQTCREMDEFTERNRFKTKTLYPMEGSLLITVGEDSKTRFDFEIIPHLNHIEDTLKTYRDQANKFRHNSIIDPYNQLSAFRFTIIVVNYSKLSEMFFDSYSLKKVFLPLMQKLRLQCDLLGFYDIDVRRHCAHNSIIQSYVQCAQLHNHTTLLSSEYRPNKSFKQEYLGDFLDTPTNLLSMIGHLEYAYLRNQKSKDRFVYALEELLEDLSINQNDLGNLKQIIIETYQTQELTKPSGLVNLWQGEAVFEEEKQNLRLYKLPFKDRVAMIAQILDDKGTYVVDFLTCYSRQTLYNYLSESMLTDVFESPGVYNSFFAAKDDVAAMEALNPPPPPPQAEERSTSWFPFKIFYRR